MRNRIAFSGDRVRNCLMLGEGLCAEIKLSDEHLQLFAERNALGVQASVYNVGSKNWIETVTDIAEAQATASAHATGTHGHSGLEVACLGMEKIPFSLEVRLSGIAGPHESFKDGHYSALRH